MKKYDLKKYKLFLSKNSLRYNCHYCGLNAPYLDYMPPLEEYEYYVDENIDCIKVPICKECKDLSSQCCEEFMTGRFDEIKWLLENKYQKELEPTEWTDDELNELDFALYEYVIAHKKLAKSIRERLDWGMENYPVLRKKKINRYKESK